MKRLASLALASVLAVGCGGGSPLLHPARTLPTGEVRAMGGMSANVAVGSIAEDLRNAENQASRSPDVPGPAGTNEEYARGALVAAAVAPGLAPFAGGRVGIGNRFEGGIAYTGRGARIDARRSFDYDNISFSAGAGFRAAFYGQAQGSPLPNVDLEQLRGYGADIPLLIGWMSRGGLYQAWAGLRGGWDHVNIEQLRSEPKAPTFVVPPISLEADRFFGGGLVGLATGFRHLHVAFELEVSYQSVSGRYNGTRATIQGISLVPSSALWWDF